MWIADVRVLLLLLMLMLVLHLAKQAIAIPELAVQE
jgi:hypothetical protein